MTPPAALALLVLAANPAPPTAAAPSPDDGATSLDQSFLGERERAQLAAYRDRRKHPWLAASLSLTFPGAGQAYLGEWGDAAVAASLPLAGAGLGGVLLVEQVVRRGGLDVGGSQTFTFGGLPGLAFIAAQAAYFYNVYDAYRSAHRHNAKVRAALGLPPVGLPLPDESTFEHLAAPFDPRVLVKPEVIAATLGLVGAVITLQLAIEWVATLTPPHLYEGSVFDVGEVSVLGRTFAPVEGFLLAQSMNTVVSMSAGVGEEALFRGVLQHQLSAWFGRWWGWALSSLAFGAIHAPNALFLSPPQAIQYLVFSLPVVTAVGSVLGLISMKNDHALREVIAIHFWYDALLLGTSVIYGPKSHPFSASISARF